MKERCRRRWKEISARVRKDLKNIWIAVIAIACYTVLMHLIFHAFCPMVIVTGFPCPGCGMTRAVFYLLTGQAVQSVRMHPMGIPIVCIGVYFLWNRYITGRRAKGMKALIMATLILLIVCYVWRMCLFFPDREPYVYTKDNLLAGLLPFYERILYQLKII